MDIREEHKPARPDAAWLRDYLKARLTIVGLDLWSFWNKLHRDWVIKFASMLAYQFIIALFPLLLFMLGVYSMVAPLLSRADAADVQQGIASLLPLGIGPAAIGAATAHLHHASGWLLLLGLALAIGAGAHLFYSLQDCANIIFRLQSRNYFIKQAIAIAATLLYCGIVPFAFALSLAPVHWLHLPMPHGWLAHSLAFVLGWIAASCLLALLYKIMTEGSVAWRAVWPGAIIASLLLILYEQLFPLYVHSWLKPDNYGAVVGFILIVLAFFYYLAFIVLLGMEITSWRAGQRETGASLPTIIHAVQVNRTLRGVAGPNAGKPSEDLRQHAAKDKKDDAPHSPSPARRGRISEAGG